MFTILNELYLQMNSSADFKLNVFADYHKPVEVCSDDIATLHKNPQLITTIANYCFQQMNVITNAVNLTGIVLKLDDDVVLTKDATDYLCKKVYVGTHFTLYITNIGSKNAEWLDGNFSIPEKEINSKFFVPSTNPPVMIVKISDTLTAADLEYICNDYANYSGELMVEVNAVYRKIFGILQLLTTSSFIANKEEPRELKETINYYEVSKDLIKNKTEEYSGGVAKLLKPVKETLVPKDTLTRPNATNKQMKKHMNTKGSKPTIM